MTEPEQSAPNENETKAVKLVESISAHLKNAEDSLVKVTKTVEEIDAYVTIFKDARSKFDDPKTGVEASLVSSQNTVSEITTLKTTAENNLTQIKDALASVNSNINEMTKAYGDFSVIKAKVEDDQTGLNAVLAKAQAIEGEITTLKTTAENNLTQIKDALASVNSNINEMTKAYGDFSVIKAKVEDDQTGLNAVLISATALHQEIDVVKGQSTGLYLAIQKLRDESSTHAQQIIKFREDSDAEVIKIKENERISLESKDKILEFYEIATGASLAGSFDARKKELVSSVKVWYLTLVWSTIVLLLSVGTVYVTSITNGTVDLRVFISRILLTSPVIFFTAFATERYTHERSLLEKYAFKSATASALESYTKLLKNTFKATSDDEKILTFVIDSMSTIYKEPFDKKNESKFTLGVNTKLGEIKGELAQVNEAIDLIKKVVEPKQDIKI